MIYVAVIRVEEKMVPFILFQGPTVFGWCWSLSFPKIETFELWVQMRWKKCIQEVDSHPCCCYFRLNLCKPSFLKKWEFARSFELLR